MNDYSPGAPDMDANMDDRQDNGPAVQHVFHHVFHYTAPINTGRRMPVIAGLQDIPNDEDEAELLGSHQDELHEDGFESKDVKDSEGGNTEGEQEFDSSESGETAVHASQERDSLETREQQLTHDMSQLNSDVVNSEEGAASSPSSRLAEDVEADVPAQYDEREGDALRQDLLGGVEDNPEVINSDAPNFYTGTESLAQRYTSLIQKAGGHALKTTAQASSLLDNSAQYEDSMRQLAGGLKSFNLGVKHFREETRKVHVGHTKNIKNALVNGIETGLDSWQDNE